MNDDDQELRIYAGHGRGRGPRRPARSAPAAPAGGAAQAVQAQTLPAAPVRTPPMSPVRPRAACAGDAAGADKCPARARRATQELPAAARLARPAPPPELGPAPAEPRRRITREIPVPPSAPAIDQILRILRAPPEWGETIEGAFSRKERELAAVLEGLEPEEAGKLFRRLSSPQPDDPVAAAFGRLVPERRGRLLGFLVSARRRAHPSHPSQPPHPSPQP